MIWKYITVFLTGCLVVLLGVVSYLLKNVKPIIQTDSYVEAVNQSIRKLKQSGNGTITIEPEALKTDLKIEDKPPESLRDWIRQRRANKLKNKSK